MRSFFILSSILTFIFVFGLYAMDQASRERIQVAMESLRRSNVAYVSSRDTRQYVLGAVTTAPANYSLTLVATQDTTAFALLQQTHMVVVEYTESGAVIHAVDGVGMKDDERASQKKWSFMVNGKKQDVAPDRTVVRAHDQVVWMYQ